MKRESRGKTKKRGGWGSCGRDAMYVKNKNKIILNKHDSSSYMCISLLLYFQRKSKQCDRKIKEPTAKEIAIKNVFSGQKLFSSPISQPQNSFLPLITQAK